MTRSALSLSALLVLVGCSVSNDPAGGEANGSTARSLLDPRESVDSGSDGGTSSDGGTGSDGGDGGPPPYEPPVQPPFPWEATCSSAPSCPWVPRPAPTCNEGDYLHDIRADVVGHWMGTVTTKWQAPYSVALELTADGHYSARCIDSNCIAFYYGTDLNTPLKQYRLLDVSALGQVSGEIDIAFDYETQFGLPAWQGQIEELEMNADSSRLRFEFWTGNGYGPVRFDVHRCD